MRETKETALTEYTAFAGNIAAGKTACARAFAAATGAHLVEEAVIGNPYLEKFYVAPARWAFRLQMFNLASRSSMILDALDRGRLVLDRSFEEDVLFVDLAFEQDLITSDEYDVYKRLYHALLRAIPQPSRLVFLRVSRIETLLDRITTRGRPMEQGVDLSYLQNLHDRYEEWIEEYPGAKIVLDGTSGSPEQLAEEIANS